ncbi:magnesium-translocating P-type ATPase [Actinoallomurus liliacearum]|uniref:Magnesium-transporting ATPase, P-type 1 n=1 Tax=Actinoallomurus liliacearum TaxID=1080073 RepID=A0ABP8TDI9_9ACTN
MAWAPESASALPEPRPDAADEPRLPDVRGRLAEYAAMPVLQVLRRLDSGPRGLEEDRAQTLLARHGENAIAGPTASRRGSRLLHALTNPFVGTLLVLGGVSAALGAFGAATVIGVMVLISCWLQVRQEQRFDRVADTLRAMVVATTTVVRRATSDAPPTSREVPLDQLVPGDIVTLSPGDMIPADVRLLRSAGLAVDQAVLTGEALPVAKQATPEDAVPDVSAVGRSTGDLATIDCPWLCFMGSTVTAGTGTAVVLATGTATYFGAMHAHLAPRRAETAFDRGVKGVSRALIGLMLVCAPLVFIVNAAVHGIRFAALWFGISVAVGLTPEMLPVMVSTALARGARAAVRHNVVIKRLPAIHNLGAMDVLCTDKTGTLTQDQVGVDCHIDPDGRSDPQVLRWAALNSAVAADGDAIVLFNELDEALLAYADQMSVPVDDVTAVEVIPFDSTRRRGSVVVREAGRPGTDLMITKGAVEQVLECCTRLRRQDGDVPLTAADRQRLGDVGDRYAADGVRLLAVAIADKPVRPRAYGPKDERDLTLIGFVGFRDRPRESAAAAVRSLAARGVAVKVLTGDHPLVAARICRDAGIDPGRIVLGDDIEALSDAEIGDLADRTTVFARIDPEQKARIVRVLRSTGRTVGFLGDGVNDSPALRDADVGITVDGAVAIARESADVVLLRGDLLSVAEAVTEGRRTFTNIKKYLEITISSNFGNVLSMLAASVLLPFLPMLPLQILVQNLCFDLCLLPLAFDHVDQRALRRPQTFDSARLTRFVLWLGPVNTLADLTAFGILLHITGHHPGPAAQAIFHTGWFVENLLTQAAAVHLLRGRRLPSPRDHAAFPVLLGTTAIVTIALVLPWSPLAAPLSMTALPVVCLLALVLVLVLYCLLIGAAKTAWQKVEGRTSRPTRQGTRSQAQR